MDLRISAEFTLSGGSRHKPVPKIITRRDVLAVIDSLEINSVVKDELKNMMKSSPDGVLPHFLKSIRKNINKIIQQQIIKGQKENDENIGPSESVVPDGI